MAVADRGYANLLTHLHRPTTTLPFQTIQAAISHYLARLTPTPTPLAAIVVSSPLFHPFSHGKLQTLATAFRQAALIRYQVVEDDQGGLFARSLRTRLRHWAAATVKGIQGGQPIIRLACAGGLLLGLEDLRFKLESGEGGLRRAVEDDVVVALAEVMDTYMYIQSSSSWEQEFQPATENGEVDGLSLALILASQSLPLVSEEKLKALPLRAFARLVTSSIDAAFHSGNFLSTLSSSVAPHESYTIYIAPSTPLPQEIKKMTSSPLLSSIGPLTKICARILSLLLDSKSEQGIIATAETLQVLEALAIKVESDWAASAISSTTDENSIAPESREYTKDIWTVLKTLMFSTIMIADTSLSALVFVSPTAGPLTSAAPSQIFAPSPASLALTVLHALSHLSFVITQFGGVTTTSESGFPELKKAFYLALDILSADPSAGERFVLELCGSFHSEVSGISSSNTARIHPFQQAKKAYALASIEQIVPILSEECIEQYVFPFCVPHLSDPAHRETYESAHSVILAIFASHAQQTGEMKPKIKHNRVSSNYKGKGKEPSVALVTEPLGISERMIPFYVNCLIENSVDGMLNTSQLRLAFSAVVRSASASASAINTTTPSFLNESYTLTWFCIDALLSAIHALSPSVPEHADRLHRLHLTLISTVPSLPLTLLPRVLEEIRTIISTYPEAALADNKVALIQALFAEILDKVGDREKEFALQWWYDNQKNFVHSWEGKDVAGSNAQSQPARL